MSCSCGTALALRAWAETLNNFERDVSLAEADAKEITEAVKEAESFFAQVKCVEIPKIESVVNSAAAQLTIETETVLKEMAKATTTETLLLAKQEEAVSQIESLSEQVNSLKLAIEAKRAVVATQKQTQKELVGCIERSKVDARRFDLEIAKTVAEVASLKEEVSSAQSTLQKISREFESLKSIESEIPITLADFEAQQEEVERELTSLQAEHVKIAADIEELSIDLDALANSEDAVSLTRREQVASELEERLAMSKDEIDARVFELRPMPETDPFVTQRLKDETLCRVLCLRALRQEQLRDIDEVRDVLRRNEERTIQAIKRLQPNLKK